MKKLFFIFVLFACLTADSLSVKAAETYVDVHIAPFTVRLNGVITQNAVNQYPLIVYNDITYFPMSYHDSRFLGVETVWTAEHGLSVKKGTSGDYHVYDTYINDLSQTYKARVVTQSIMVNGKTKTGGQYPFLSFRNVTYFPLTWEYAVNEFGWHYHWNAASGLTIETREYDDSEQETILNIINEMVFSKSYSFIFELKRSGQDTVIINGKMQGSFREGAQKSDISNYNSDFQLNPASIVIDNAELLGWSLTYLVEGAKATSLNINASYPPFLSSNPLLAEQFHLLDERREAVAEVEKISEENDQESKYRITFQEESIWAQRMMDVTIGSGNHVTELVISDYDYHGEYTLRAQISNVERWR